MNRIYKVVWNEALHCFTAVGEYAKARGKSSKSSVSSNATINTTSTLSSINTLRLSAIGLGLLAAGFVVQTNAEVSYSNFINITGHQSQGQGHDTHGNGNGYGHETHGNGNGYGHDENGHNGNNGNNRIGLKFAGDTGGTITRNQGETLNIKGGETDTTKLTSGNNIGVVSNGSNTLTIKLAKDLTGLNSASFNSGVVISATGINAGNKVISGVANGVSGSDAVNVNQLNSSVAANKTKYYSVNSTATGNSNNDGATGQNAMAMGGNATATGIQAIAIGSGQSGQDTTASGQQSIAIGANVVSKGHSSIALGGDDLDYASKANIGSSSASATLNGGTVNTTFKDYAGKNLVEPNRYDINTESGGAASIAVGVKALSKGDLSTAVGVHANSAGTASSAFGMAASATKKGALALGAGAKADAQDGVALGSQSIATVAGGATGFVPTGTLSIDENAIIATRSVTLGAVSVGTGAQGGNRQIVNVAAGTNDSDAVNVAQLVGLQNGINSTINQGIDFGGDSGTNVNRKLGEKLLVKGGETDITKLTSGNNIGVVADGTDTLTLKLAKDLTGLDSVTTGNSLLNTEGIRFLGGSSVRLSQSGLDNGGNRITNVADGADDTDGVNVRQLKATNSTVDLGLDFTGDDTTVNVNRKLGQTLTIQGGATTLTDNNIGVVADENGNLNVRLAEDVVLGRAGSVRMENTVLNNAGVTITDGPNQTVTLSNEGLDNGNNRIIKVGEGVAPSDAVNFAQLTATNNEVAKGIKIGDGNSDNDQQFALGDTINVTGDSNLTTVASATGVQVKLNNRLNLGDEGSMQIGNSIMNNAGFTFVDNGFGRTVSLSNFGLDNGGNPIRNVGKGTLNTDAVNVEQLREIAIALDQGWGITAQGDIATQVRQGNAVDLNSRDGNIKVSRTLVSNGAGSNANRSLAAIPASANDISFDLNPDISVVSVTAGDTTINDNGLVIAGGPSVTKSGIDAADNKVTNVRNGAVTATSQDAINGSQLYAQGSGISSIIGGNTVYNAENGTFTNSNIGGTNQSSIDGAIASIRQGTIEINENVQTNTTNIATNTTNITTNTTNIATNTRNITTNATNIKANTDRLDAGLNFGADSGATINKPVGDSSVLKFTGGNNVTTTAQSSGIKFDLNNNITLDSVKTGNTTVNNTGVTIVDGPSMTASGIDAASKKITNVADGMAPRDAVNFGQLDAVSRQLGDNMNQLGYKISEVEDDANAGISAAMAMSALPQAYISGKSMIGGGIGTYNGESAVAIGFSKLSNDGRWVMKLNGTADTQGNAGASIGAGFHFD